ncbi:MAG: PEP-CTERM sorting domain-containing protein [Planctomycetes bacterium]|nr:PEP-CTERM sorting domain-containing protein [Planctomycetota bacterium]
MRNSTLVTVNQVAPSTCPCCDCGDFNEDGSTDGLDFLAWQRGFGTAPAVLSQGDGNGDGNVDGIDLAIWEQSYGTVAPLSTTSAAVPEPSTCGLALAALCLAMSRRRAQAAVGLRPVFPE